MIENVLLRRDRGRLQPREFAAMPFGQHGGEDELRRRARRRWRRNLCDDFTRDPIGHLVANGGIQLRCA